MFGRPLAELDSMFADDDPLVDLWSPATESRDDILGFWDRAWTHSDATLDALDLDAPGRVPWWPDDRADVTLQQILVHMLAELQRHLGHADLARELIDGAIGMRAGSTNLPETNWLEHYERIESAARAAAGR